MDIRVTGMDPSGYNIATADLLTVYSATSTEFVVAKTTTGTFVSGGTAHAKEEVNPDLGFAGGYYDAGYAHAGLFRDASDNTFKFFQGYTPEPDEAVNIDTTHASFSLANIRANEAVFEYIFSTDIHANSMRTGGYNGIKFWFGPGASLDLVVDGTSFTEQTITIPDATGTLALLESPTFTGTVSIPTLNLTNALGYAYGGTGLSTLGTAGQVLRTNSAEDALEWGLTLPINTSEPDYVLGMVNSTEIGWRPGIPSNNLSVPGGILIATGGSGYVDWFLPGTAGQVLTVNATEDGLEWGTGGGGGSSAAAVTSDPPSTPELNQVWQDLDNGRIYVWDGDFWIEVQQNGSLGLLRYLGASATAPTTSIDGSDLQVGEVYFDTVFNVMKVYDGTGWEDAFTAGSLSVSRWIYTATGGETTLSGDDDNDVTLAYTAGIEEVYLNGVKLIRTSDYLATDGEEITLEPLVAGSVVEVISYSGFTVADTYTKSEVDDLIQKQGVRWTLVAPVGSSITTLSGTDDYANTLAYTPGTEQVFVNGILIVRGVDYTATNGTSVVLGTALAPGDVVEVIGNSSFSVANTYTKTEVDNKLNSLTSPTISGNTSAAGNISPSVTNTYDLGTTSLRWRNIYTQDLHLSNGIGDYTVIEGEEDLFLVNNKSGKSFKFALIEVDPSQVPPKSESN